VTVVLPRLAPLAWTLAGCRATAPELVSADAAPSQTTPHVHIVEAPAAGDVAPIVRDAVARAKGAPDGANGAFVVYVGATWCEPCQRFHHAAERGELDAAFPGMTLLEFDLDRDRDRLRAAGYTSKLIPLFALPADDGTATGKQVEGGIKGEGAVGFMVPRLQAILTTRGS
jgi:thiol-disulfide isomerase/thioredoxin